MYNKTVLAIALAVGILVVFALSYTNADALSTFLVGQGGTGTTSPSGILSGDNGATNHLNTVVVGSGLSYSGNTLSATGGGTGTVTQVNTTYPVLGGPITNTGTISLDFGTTTSNTWAGTQTFTNSPVLSTLTAGTVNSTASGSLYSTSSSTPALSSSFAYTGTLGSFVGGTSGTLSLAANGVLLNRLNQVGANTVLGNATGATGNVTAIATSSLFQNASASNSGLLTSTDWTTFNNKGSGSVTSIATNNGITGGTITTTGTIGLAAIGANSLLGNNTGASAVPSAIATSSLGLTVSSFASPNISQWTNNSGYLTSAITTLGPTGQTQTGATQTLASSTGSFNGLTTGVTIVGSGNTQTFTPSLTGTLNNAGLTNSTISGVALGGTLGALTATNGSLTFSGSYTGAAAQTVGLNLANANSFTALQQFLNASSTLASVTNKLYVGGTATTTIDSTGNIVVPSGSNLTVTGKTDGCATWATGVLNSTGTPCGAGGGAGTGTVSTSTPLVSGQVDFSTGVNTIGNTSTFFWDNTNKRLGVGSSTPYAQLSVDAPAGAASYFAIGSSTSEVLSVKPSASAMLGIGTSSPMSTLSVVGSENHYGAYAHFGLAAPLSQCNTALGASSCLELVGNDNTTGGVGVYEANTSAGTSAYGGYVLTNNLTGNATTNYSGTFLNSSTYSDTTFGTLNAVPNLLQIANSMGPVSIQSFAPTAAGSYINFFAGSTTPGTGPATSGEGMRLNATGLGIGTTSPSQRLSVQGNGLFSGDLSSANLTATGTVTFSALTGTQCLHEISGVVSGTGSDCGGGSGVTGTTGQVAYLSGTNTAVGTSTIFIDTNGRVGIGSTTPFAAFSVNPTAVTGSAARFVVGSSTKTDFIITNAGKVGFGTAAPVSPYEFVGASNAAPNFSVANFKSTTGDVNLTFQSLGGDLAFVGQRNGAQAYFTGPNGFSIDAYGLTTSMISAKNDGTLCAGGLATFSTCANSGLFINGTTLKTGLSTTSPIAAFTMRAASTTAGTANDGYNGTIFVIAGFENTVTKLFQVIDQWGHRITGGDTPTVSGGTSTVAGNDNNGTITVTGTLLTSVTLTFAHAWPTAPDCTMADSSTGVTGAITSISSTQVVIGFSAGVNSGTVWYMCSGHQ